MHDCVKTRELLVDLVFDELGPEARRRGLLELEGCPDCLAQYRSMTEALRVFDQVTETAMPDERYWPGYESRLRWRWSCWRSVGGRGNDGRPWGLYPAPLMSLRRLRPHSQMSSRMTKSSQKRQSRARFPRGERRFIRQPRSRMAMRRQFGAKSGAGR